MKVRSPAYRLVPIWIYA